MRSLPLKFESSTELVTFAGFFDNCDIRVGDDFERAVRKWKKNIQQHRITADLLDRKRYVGKAQRRRRKMIRAGLRRRKVLARQNKNKR